MLCESTSWLALSGQLVRSEMARKMRRELGCLFWTVKRCCQMRLTEEMKRSRERHYLCWSCGKGTAGECCVFRMFVEAGWRCVEIQAPPELGRLWFRINCCHAGEKKRAQSENKRFQRGIAKGLNLSELNGEIRMCISS